MNPITAKVINLAKTCAVRRLVRKGRLLPAYLSRGLSAETLLDVIRANAGRPADRLRFRPPAAGAKEAIGMINLAVVDGRLCFLLGKRTMRASDLRGCYTLPAGKRERSRPGEEDRRQLRALYRRGLIRNDELAASLLSDDEETVLMAAIRENAQETGIVVGARDVLGRIEFAGTKPGIKVVVFVADVRAYHARELGEAADGELADFRWVPIDVLFSYYGDQAGENVHDFLNERLGRDRQLEQLMDGLRWRGMPALKDWLMAR